MATPEPRRGTRRTISIVDDVNLLSPQTRTSLLLPLGPLTTSDIGGLEGEAESSCGEEEEEEEDLFKADAVNEEDPERDRATPANKVWTTVLRPEGRRTPVSGGGGRFIQS